MWRIYRCFFSVQKQTISILSTCFLVKSRVLGYPYMIKIWPKRKLINYNIPKVQTILTYNEVMLFEFLVSCRNSLLDVRGFRSLVSTMMQLISFTVQWAYASSCMSIMESSLLNLLYHL